MGDSLDSFLKGSFVGILAAGAIGIGVIYFNPLKITIYSRPGRPNIAISTFSGKPCIEKNIGSGEYMDIRDYLEAIKDKDQRAISNAVINSWVNEYRGK